MFDFYTIFSLHQKLRYLIDLLGVSSQLTPPWYFLPTFWRPPKIGFLKILSACITLIKRVDEPFEEESIESCICKQDCLSRLENIFRDQRETENQSCNRFSKHFTEWLNISKPWSALFQNKAKSCNSKEAKQLIFNGCLVGHWPVGHIWIRFFREGSLRYIHFWYFHQNLIKYQNLAPIIGWVSKPWERNRYRNVNGIIEILI